MTGFAHVQAENDQWSKETRDCEDEVIRLGGDCIIAAAFMEYLGAFSQQHRPNILAAVTKLAAQYTYASSTLDMPRCTYCKIMGFIHSTK
jgi:hypothetical protein